MSGIKGEFGENLEDGEIDTDDDNQMLKIDISKIDQSDLRELALVKNTLLNLTKQLDKSSIPTNCSNDKKAEESVYANFKSSSKQNKSNKKRKLNNRSNRLDRSSKKSFNKVYFDQYEDIDEYELIGARGESPSAQSTSSLTSEPHKPLYYVSDDASYNLAFEYQPQKNKNRRNNHKNQRTEAIKNKNEVGGIADFKDQECTSKPICKFSHGKSLTKNYREMLLKHIKLAPKEILGNEKAIELIIKQHAKLCKEYGIEENKNSYECDGNLYRIETERIPALLDMVVKSPKETFTEIVSDFNNNPKNRNCDKDKQCSVATDEIENTTSTKSYTSNQRIQVRSRWTGAILKKKQSFAAKKKIKNCIVQQQPSLCQLPSSTKSNKFVLNLQLLTSILSMEQIQKLEALGIQNLEQLSQLSLSQLNLIGLTATQISAVQLNTMNMEKLGFLQPSINNIASPSEIQEKIDNMESSEEDELYIDESIKIEQESIKGVNSNGCCKIEKKTNLEKKHNIEENCPTTDLYPPTIPEFDGSLEFINKKVIDISSAVSTMLMATKAENQTKIITPTFRTETCKRKHSPSPIGTTIIETPLHKRSTIYDGELAENIDVNNESWKIFQTKTDTDMRKSEYIDLTQDFETLIPASEINGTMKKSTSPYRVDEIFIPDSDFKDIRRRTVENNKKIQDPRLWRMFCLKDMEAEKTNIIESFNELLTPNTPESKYNFTDVNKQKQTKHSTNFLKSSPETNSSIALEVNMTVNIDLIQYLNKSQWYKELNSKDKVIVNQQISLISIILKNFHQDMTPTKIFDTSLFVKNELLQKILICLEVYIDSEGKIKQINDTETNSTVTNQNNYFYSNKPVESVGLLSTPLINIGLEFPKNKLNQNYQNNLNYSQFQNGNVNNSHNFPAQNNMQNNYNNQLANIYQSNSLWFYQNPSQRYQLNSYFQPNFNNNYNVALNRRYNFKQIQFQYNNGHNRQN